MTDPKPNGRRPSNGRKPRGPLSGDRKVTKTMRAQARVAEKYPDLPNLLRETIGDEEYVYYKAPKCRVCTAADPGEEPLPNGQEVREQIDSLLAGGWSYVEIFRAVGPKMEDWPEDRRISYDSIRRHFHLHLPVERRMTRMVAEHWAQQAGIDVMKSSMPLMTVIGLNYLIAQRGFEKLMKGELEPTLADTRAAAMQYQALLDAASGQESLASLYAQQDIIINAIRTVLPPALYDVFAQEVKKGVSALQSLSRVEQLPVARDMTVDEIEREIEEEERRLREKLENGQEP